VGRDRYEKQDLKRYLLCTDGSEDGHVALNDRFLINPKKSLLIQKIFSEKIGGIVVGARSEDERGHAVVEKGGVGQKFVDLRVHAGNYSTEALVKVFTN
jgi:hypothetical protein